MKKLIIIFSFILCLSCALFVGCVPHIHEENYDNYCKTCDYDFAKTLVLQSDGSFVAEEQSLESRNYSFNIVGNGKTGFKFVFTSLYGHVTMHQISIACEDGTKVFLPLTAMDPFSELEYDGELKQGVKYRITVSFAEGGRGYLSVLPLE